MRPATGTPTALRTYNDAAAMRLLVDHGTLTRAELEKHTGLSKASAAEVLRRLETSGLVRKKGKRTSAAGPAAQAWALVGATSIAAGINVTADGVRAQVVDFTGEVLGSARTEDRVDDLPSAITQTIEKCCTAAGVDIAEIDDIVIGVPGVVDSGATAQQAIQLSNWNGYEELASVRERLGAARTRFENDVNLVTVAEAAQRSASNLAVLWLGADGGIGSGAVVGGELWRGTTGRAGELGSLLILNGADNEQNPLQLADLVSLEALAHLAERHGAPSISPKTPLRDLVPALLAGGGSPPFDHSGFIRAVGIRLSLGVVAAVSVLDPELVVLSGRLCEAGGEPLRREVAQNLSRTLLAPVPIALASTAGSDAVLDGASSRALESARARVLEAGTAGISTS